MVRSRTRPPSGVSQDQRVGFSGVFYRSANGEGLARGGEARVGVPIPDRVAGEDARAAASSRSRIGHSSSGHQPSVGGPAGPLPPSCSRGTRKPAPTVDVVVCARDVTGERGHEVGSGGDCGGGGGRSGEIAAHARRRGPDETGIRFKVEGGPYSTGRLPCGFDEA